MDPISKMMAASGGSVDTSWQIANASWDSRTPSSLSLLAATGQQPYNGTMAGNGLHFYTMRWRHYNSGFKTEVTQYNLSTAWDLSTASLDGFQTIGRTGGQGVGVNYDGTKQYRLYSDGKLRQWSVSSSNAWDFQGNASYDGEVDLSSYGNNRSVAWSSDGSKMFYYTTKADSNGNNNKRVKLFTASTNFDALSTLTYSTQSSILPSTYNSFAMKPDGTIMYFTDDSNAYIYQHNLGTAYDLSTLSTTADSTLDLTSDITSEGTQYITFEPNGEFFFTKSNKPHACINKIVI